MTAAQKVYALSTSGGVPNYASTLMQEQYPAMSAAIHAKMIALGFDVTANALGWQDVTSVYPYPIWPAGSPAGSVATEIVT